MIDEKSSLPQMLIFKKELSAGDLKVSTTLANTKTLGPNVERLCNFVAINRAQKGDEVLKELVLQCFLISPDVRFTRAEQFNENLDVLFGLQIPIRRVQTAIDQLVSEGKVQRRAKTNLTLEPEVHATIDARIKDALALQERVKATWLESIAITHPELDPVQVWDALQAYLSRAFRRHGMQTIALLDTSVDTPEYSDSLRLLLHEAIGEICGKNPQKGIESSIVEFFDTVGTDPDRTSYIVQLADGVFSCYSLTVPPEISSQLRTRLKELTLFLDTNFLFGILDLNDNPLVDVSRELLNVIKEHHLPFKLRYHEATEREMRRTIQGIVNNMKGRRWSQAISRAAAKSNTVSSFERRFHQLNAESPLDVEMFLKPLDHFDVLLKEKGIEIYRASGDRLQQRADLLHEYEGFLAKNDKEKPYEALDHDVTLLDCVHQLRSKARSSLDAKALGVTCDYLFRLFDWKVVRNDDQMACLVLPNQFLQLLRPFIPASADFDRSFAKTFAIPEFRTVSSGATAACSKMLTLLATYKDVNEEIVEAMLVNDILLTKLQQAKNDAEFKRYVESAIIAENNQLLEEKVALEEQIKREKLAQAEREREQENERQKLLAERDQLATKLQAEQNQLAEKEKFDSVRQVEIGEQLKLEQQARESAEKRAAEAEAATVALAAKSERKSDIITVTISLTAFVGFAVIAELLVYRLPWAWLLNHPNSYGIRASVYLTVLLFFIGLLKKSWRKGCWGTGIVAIAAVLLQIIGGPAKKN